MSEIAVSENIALFLKFLRDVKASYPIVYDEMRLQERVREDCHHFREGVVLKNGEQTKLNPKELRRLNKIEKQCLVKRRESKDILEKYSPIIEFLEDSNTEAFIKKLERVLGDVRNVEKYHSQRFYTPKALCPNDIFDCEGLDD